MDVAWDRTRPKTVHAIPDHVRVGSILAPALLSLPASPAACDECNSSRARCGPAHSASVPFVPAAACSSSSLRRVQLESRSLRARALCLGPICPRGGLFLQQPATSATRVALVAHSAWARLSWHLIRIRALLADPDPGPSLDLFDVATRFSEPFMAKIAANEDDAATDGAELLGRWRGLGGHVGASDLIGCERDVRMSVPHVLRVFRRTHDELARVALHVMLVKGRAVKVPSSAGATLEMVRHQMTPDIGGDYAAHPALFRLSIHPRCTTDRLWSRWQWVGRTGQRP